MCGVSAAVGRDPGAAVKPRRQRRTHSRITNKKSVTLGKLKLCSVRKIKIKETSLEPTRSNEGNQLSHSNSPRWGEQ